MIVIQVAPSELIRFECIKTPARRWFVLNRTSSAEAPPSSSRMPTTMADAPLSLLIRKGAMGDLLSSGQLDTNANSTLRRGRVRLGELRQCSRSVARVGAATTHATETRFTPLDHLRCSCAASSFSGNFNRTLNTQPTQFWLRRCRDVQILQY